MSESGKGKEKTLGLNDGISILLFPKDQISDYEFI